jgi:hypothetical protein
MHQTYITAGGGYSPSQVQTSKDADEVTIDVRSKVVPVYYLGVTTVNPYRGLMWESKVMSNGGALMGIGIACGK